MIRLSADQALEACRTLGLRYSPDLRQPDGLWTAQCPVCVLYSDKLVLMIREPERDGHVTLHCGNGCKATEVMARLAAAVPSDVQPSSREERPLAVRTADLTLSAPPEWAWQQRIVLGALNLIVGVEGAGKGTLACWIFAKLTQGKLPGDLYGRPSTIVLVGDEDGFSDVWTPRLHAAKADLDRVKLVERGDGSLIELGPDRQHLGEIIEQEEVRLLYLDQLTDNLGAAVDDWKAKQVREALAPARQLARDFNCAVLGSLHPNKSGGSFRQLVSGSIAFNALSRSSLLLAEHPDDPDRRVLVRAKGNLSAIPEAVEFAIESCEFTANGYAFDVPRAVGFSTSDLTTDDLINTTPTPPRPAGKARTGARDLIAELLDDGDWHKAAEVIDACGRQDIYARAAQRAATDLGVEQEKRGFPAASYWRLPQRGHTDATPKTTVVSVASVVSASAPQATNAAPIGRGDSNDRADSENACHIKVSSPLNALTADCADVEEMVA